MVVVMIISDDHDDHNPNLQISYLKELYSSNKHFNLSIMQSHNLL